MGARFLFLAIVILVTAAGPADVYVAPAAGAGAGAGAAVAETQIDRLIGARLHALGAARAGVCSDAVFLRRAYLDVIGTLPTEKEAREFLADKSASKRWVLVDKLLGREEFADYWAMKWGDVLRVKAEFPINLWPNAAQAYHRWIRTSVRENKPYDRFARELLLSSGSNFRVGEVNFYRAVQDRGPAGLAGAVALTFMGERVERWPKERLAGMAVFFAQVGYKSTGEWKEEIVFNDVRRAASRPAVGVLPDGTEVTLPVDGDPRAAFVDWLVSETNPAFARCAVNRVWGWLMGRGIVHEVDDFRADNPPVNPELLDYLARQLVAGGWDLKHVYRLILNSRTYQAASAVEGLSAEAEANFAAYALRRVDAEVLADAICQITGTVERYTSPIPEPFTFIPEGQRSVGLPDASITSSFLELFGRPGRDTGLESERNNRVTAAQRLHLLNSSHVQRKLEQAKVLQWPLVSASGNFSRERVNTIYLTILSRYPTERELAAAEAYARSGVAKGREATVDLAWALVNSTEFLYRH